MDRGVPVVTADEVLAAVVGTIFDVRKQTLLPGSHWHDHTNEKDLLVLGGGKKPKLTEVEIKVSIADWKRDAYKVTNRYRPTAHGLRYLKKYECIANRTYLGGMLSRFYIACPRSLWEVARVKLDETSLPDWAGVIAVGEAGVAGQTTSDNSTSDCHPYTEIVREAQEFHEAKPVPEGARAEFHRLCYFRFWTMQREHQRLQGLARALSEASSEYTAGVAEAWAEVAKERELRMAAENRGLPGCEPLT
jgi:hypothetical protein